MILCLCPNPSVDTFVWIDDETDQQVDEGLRAGGVYRAQREAHYPGGKGVHVALAASELGQRVMLLGYWAGPTGAWIKTQCERQRVTCIGPEVAGWSRTCLTIKREGQNHETQVLGMGPQVFADLRTLMGPLNDALVDAECVTMSGSWPRGAPADAYARAIAACHEAGKPVFLDCSGELLREALKHRPHALHVNLSEARAFLNVADIDTAAAASALNAHCSLAVVSDGARGAHFASEGKRVHAVCEAPRVHSSVGSGDCMLGAMAVAFERKLSLEETARLAAACGAANCLRPELGMFHRADLRNLMGKTAIT